MPNSRPAGLSPALALGLAALAGAGASAAASPDGAAELVARAWEQFQAGEYLAAERGFAAARAAAAEDSDAGLMARYGLGMTWWLRGSGPDPARARRWFEEVIRIAPRHDLAAWSALALARMRHLAAPGEEPDDEAVQAAYRAVEAAHPGHPAALEAFLYRQAVLIRTLDPGAAKRARADLEAFARDRRGSPFESWAWELIVEACHTLQDWDAKLAAAIRALETRELDPTNPWADHAAAYWRIATIAEFEAANFAVAKRYYSALVREYPTDQKRYAAKLALERLARLERSWR